MAKVKLNKDVPVSPEQKLFMRAQNQENSIGRKYLAIIDIIVKRTCEKNPGKVYSVTASRELTSSYIGDKSLIRNTIHRYKKTGEARTLHNVVMKLLKAKL